MVTLQIAIGLMVFIFIMHAALAAGFVVCNLQAARQLLYLVE